MELFSKSNVAGLNLKLNGQNYDVWSMKIQHLLQEQEVLDALSLVMVQPEEGTTSQHRMDLEAYVAWRKKNYTARIILLSAMDDDIARPFHMYENAMDLWVTLERKFGGVFLTKLRSMTIYFDSYKKHPDHTVRRHLREIYKMICELRDVGHKMTEEQKIQAVIRSLPDSWDHMKMFLIHNENIRTFEDVGRHLELEEDRLTSIKLNVLSH